jgi:hypothetical protein
MFYLVAFQPFPHRWSDRESKETVGVMIEPSAFDPSRFRGASALLHVVMSAEQQ